MKPKQTIALSIVAMLLASCATIQPGNDPVVVNAERITQLAVDTFNTVEKTEFDTYPALKAANPSVAADVRTFVNNLRRNQAEWLTSARTLTKAYKENRTAENKAALSTALAVLQAAVNESTKYLAEMANATNSP